jgi:Flp pilus assembly pilin Flp
MDRFNVWVGALVARIGNMKDESGQTFVEYALLLGVIVVGLLLLTTWTGLGTAIGDAIAKVTDQVD